MIVCHHLFQKEVMTHKNESSHDWRLLSENMFY
jgi:hypothetical protein